MLKAITVVLAAASVAVLASYAMWRACNRSGLAAMVAGVIFGVLAFFGAILIGWLDDTSFLGLTLYHCSEKTWASETCLALLATCALRLVSQWSRDFPARTAIHNELANWSAQLFMVNSRQLCTTNPDDRESQPR